MAHKGATQQRNSGRRRGGPTPAPTRLRIPAARTGGLERALWILTGLSAAIALIQLYLHAQLAATHGSYTSFCNVNAAVNCDAVLMSPYSVLLGVPMAAWGFLSYVTLAVLLYRRGQAVGDARSHASLLTLGLALWNVAVSVYMAGISTFAIGAFCLLCAAMYLLVIATAVLVWRLVRVDLARSARPVLTSRRALGGVGIILAGIAVIAALHFAARPISGATMTADDVKARDREFFDWYTTLPVTTDLPPSTHAKGPESAPLTIIEFSDFECPACAMAFRDLHELAARHPDRVRIVFHHFPLDADCNPNVTTRMHRSACQAAIAAECAARSGKFWEYHDLLFRGQDKLGRDDLVAKAVGLGIPAEQFTACLDDPAARSRVLADANAGGRLGVKSTPTLVINGRKVEGALERSRYEYVIALERRD
ncbi:MAG: thioredoxin domain-containing protein [Deltaproteobacteria bacterium]|nr:thioredoxin domain-containing protein [Deltaproteobacteria bacterium]